LRRKNTPPITDRQADIPWESERRGASLENLGGGIMRVGECLNAKKISYGNLGEEKDFFPLSRTA
jgi:hypothetical protein